MRLFTAIEIPWDVTERLRDFLDALRPLAKVHWSPAGNLHITTKFIGEWPEARLGEMEAALRCMPKPGLIDIALRGVGWFPNAKNPRVLWLGVEASVSLADLARATERRTAMLGVPVETRAYSPHLTLARIRERVSLEALGKALNANLPDFGSFRVNAFFLYLSAGGKYTKLAEFSLE